MLTAEEVKKQSKKLFRDWKLNVGRKLCELDEAWVCIEDNESDIAELNKKITDIVNEHKLPLSINSIAVSIKRIVPKLTDNEMAGTYNWDIRLSARYVGDRKPDDIIDVEFESIPSPIDNPVNDTIVASAVFEDKFGGQTLNDLTTVEFNEVDAEYNLF